MSIPDVQLLVSLVGLACYAAGCISIIAPVKFINRKRERELASWKQLSTIKNRIICEIISKQSKSGNSVVIIHGNELIEVDLSEKG